MKARDKKMNSKTFHQAGIVVPVNPRGFGYRDLPETYGNYEKLHNTLKTNFKII